MGAAQGSKVLDGLDDGACLHHSHGHCPTPSLHKKEQGVEMTQPRDGEGKQGGIQQAAKLTNGVCTPHVAANGEVQERK